MSNFTESYMQPEDWQLIQNLTLHLNWISFLCSFFEVITFLLFKREFPRSMPLQLGVVTCLLHLGVLIGPIVGFNVLNDGPRSFCYIQAALLQFSSMAIGCWLLNISVHLYCAIILRWSTQRLLGLVPYIHVFGWFFPLLTTIPPLAAEKVVPRSFWCWVSNEANGVWELSCYYVPIMVILVLTAVLWTAVMIRVCKISTQFKTVTYSIQSVLIVFFLSISITFQCAHRIYNHSGGDSFTLELLHTISVSTIGILVFLVYGLNYDNVQLYRRVFKSFCCTNKETTHTQDYSPLNFT